MSEHKKYNTNQYTWNYVTTKRNILCYKNKLLDCKDRCVFELPQRFSKLKNLLVLVAFGNKVENLFSILFVKIIPIPWFGHIMHKAQFHKIFLREIRKTINASSEIEHIEKRTIQGYRTNSSSLKLCVYGDID